MKLDRNSRPSFVSISVAFVVCVVGFANGLEAHPPRASQPQAIRSLPTGTPCLNALARTSICPRQARRSRSPLCLTLHPRPRREGLPIVFPPQPFVLLIWRVRGRP